MRRTVRTVQRGTLAFVDKDRPILAHVISMRRCNLSCSYCNEYDTTSAPVPLPVMEKRVDKLGELGTVLMTLSGGEPLMHPELEGIIARGRRWKMFVTAITNGYYLSPERIRRLNEAGLDHLQISIDNVEPDEVSMKSLRLLEPKLKWLREYADFTVNINSVVGSGVRNPEDALVVARRARELGFMTSVGIVHDGDGQLRGLPDRDMKIYEELRKDGSQGLIRFNRHFQDNLARGLPNEWSCRAGARYLYIDEGGLVQYCSQQRGVLAIPLERYTKADLRREYDTPKSCAPYCTVNCVQQVGVWDSWRSPQRREIRVTRPPSTDPSTAPAPGD